MAGWGGRDRTSEWRNQNPLDYSTISRRAWKRWSKQALAIPIGWQSFPNEKQPSTEALAAKSRGELRRGVQELRCRWQQIRWTFVLRSPGLLGLLAGRAASAAWTKQFEPLPRTPQPRS